MEALDQELVEQVLAGRTDAFNLLVWRWQRPLYNFLLRLSGQREPARDLAQETFLRAFTRLQELREPAKFGPWIFRIAVNLYRSARRSPRAGEVSVTDLDPAMADLPPDAESRELQLAVRTLLDRLSPEQREVVVLRVYQGFRFDEIAGILDLPVSTVKTRLYKAFELLRQGLEARTRA